MVIVKYPVMPKRRKPAAFFGFQATKEVASSLLRWLSEDHLLIVAVDQSMTNFTIV